MLERLLNEIQRGGTVEPETLAARLDTSPELVKMMLEHLERLGRLQSMQDCAGQGCSGCSLSESCTPKTRPARVWRVRAG